MNPGRSDSQFDERFGILRNKLGCVTAEDLTRKASEYATARLLQLTDSPINGRFDIPHLRAIHRHIFQDVFPWAGDFREVMTARTGSFGFPPPQYLIPSLETLLAALKAENHLKALTPDTFAIRAAHYLGEINAIHPFREGNGRSQREYTRRKQRSLPHQLRHRRQHAARSHHPQRLF
jgi:cell filamentation protein